MGNNISFGLLFTSLFSANCVTAQIAESKSSFKTEEAEFYNGKIKLSATIFLPAGKGEHPAIAVTHGSGKDSKSHAGYISLASILANEGFVVLIYDKRGVGSSTVEYIETPDMAAPAGDLAKAVEYLSSILRNNSIFLKSCPILFPFKPLSVLTNFLIDNSESAIFKIYDELKK